MEVDHQNEFTNSGNGHDKAPLKWRRAAVCLPGTEEKVAEES